MEKTKYILVGSALFNWCETQRMIEIADELSLRGYKIVFLGQGTYDFLLDGKDYIREVTEYDSEWYTPERIAMMLGMDRYGNNYATLHEVESIISAEIDIIKKYSPVAILTGYRMSLTVSAKLCGIPIIWSLSATLSKIYLQSVALNASKVNSVKRDSKLSYNDIRALFEDKIACDRLLGECKTSNVWNTFLKNNKCLPFSCDLDIYTGDLNLMSDACELFPDLAETENYKFIGPILNNQYIKMPEAVNEIMKKNNGRKKVLISIGSSGKKEYFKQILKSTLDFDCDFFVSVVGILSDEEICDYPDNYCFCEKFPLIEIAELCDAAIIQGGQGTLYAVLAGKCPFVSLPATFEQRQNVENILKHRKCGELLRSFSVNEKNIKTALASLLSSDEYKEETVKASESINKYFADRKYSSVMAANYIEEMLFKREKSITDKGCE